MSTSCKFLSRNPHNCSSCSSNFIITNSNINISYSNSSGSSFNIKKTKMMLAATANLPSRRRKLNGNHHHHADEERIDVMDWAPSIPASSTVWSCPSVDAQPSCAAATTYGHHSNKRRKRVRFHEPSTGKVSVTTLEALTEEEHNNVWYSREEYSALQSALRNAVKLFRSSNWTVTSKGQCRRGLEKYQLYYERKRMERQHFDAVLGEQKRQLETGIHDAELLRQASLITSTWALQNAQRTAQHDAFVCYSILEQQLRKQFFLQSQRTRVDLILTTPTPPLPPSPPPPTTATTATTVLDQVEVSSSSCGDGDDDYDNDSNEVEEIVISPQIFDHVDPLIATSRLSPPPPSQRKISSTRHQHGKKPVATTPLVALA